MKKEPYQSGNVTLWLLGIVLTGGVIILLARAFPDSLSSQNSQTNLVHSLAILVLLGSSLTLRLKNNLSQNLKYAAVWIIILVILILAYSYRHEFRNAKQRVLGELLPSHAVTTEDGSLKFRQAEDGHYYIYAHVNGQKVKFMVDTGASDVVLSLETAQRIGINTDNLQFTKIYSTANGTTYGAPITLRTIDIDGFTAHDIRASVNQSPMEKPLLGMSFLERLNGYEVRDETLTLWP